MGPISSLTNLSSSYLQSILSSALQSTSSTGKSQSSTGASPVAAQPENGQLSPFAQLMSTLQQLQQSNSSEYRQVAQQIGTNLKSAAQTATADGNATQATQLNQLATDFTNASQSGQLPNMQDLAQAIGGGHHHHHFHAASNERTYSIHDDPLRPPRRQSGDGRRWTGDARLGSPEGVGQEAAPAV
jgi:hypothetical protein